MLERALKPNTGHPQIKAAVSSGGRALPTRNASASASSPARRSAKTGGPRERSRGLQVFGGVWNGRLLAFVYHRGVFRTNACSRVRRAKTRELQHTEAWKYPDQIGRR